MLIAVEVPRPRPPCHIGNEDRCPEITVGSSTIAIHRSGVTCSGSGQMRFASSFHVASTCESVAVMEGGQATSIVNTTRSSSWRFRLPIPYDMDIDIPITNQQPATFANGTLHLTPDSFLNTSQNNSNNNDGGDSGMDTSEPPAKRRPGRPKGTGKKQLTGAHTLSSNNVNNNNQSIPPKRPVGRPRRDGLPAGSVGPSRSRRNAAAGANASVTGIAPQFFKPTQHQFISAPNSVQASPPSAPAIISSPPSISAPGPSRPKPVDKSHNSFEVDDSNWSELARTKSHTFLATLLVALSAITYPQSQSSLSVKEAFKSHLNSLAPTTSPIPTLYSILKTFWLPTSPAYFSLTASSSTARTPPDHRFLYWDPQPLVFNGIACPTCSTALVNRGRIKSGPLKVYDIERPFFIIGCEYVCRSRVCVEQVGQEGRKFASTDPSIWRALPNKLKDEFPARLMYSDQDTGSGPNVWNWQPFGVSKVLWNMVHGCLRAGLGREAILQVLKDTQVGVPDESDPERKSDDQEEAEVDDYLNQSFSVNALARLNSNASASASAPPVHVPQSQQSTAPPAVITDAYGDAWKANSAAGAGAGAPQQSPAVSNAELQYPTTDVEMHSPAIPTGSSPVAAAASLQQNVAGDSNTGQQPHQSAYGVYAPTPSFAPYSSSNAAGYSPNTLAQQASPADQGLPPTNTISPSTMTTSLISSASSTPAIPAAAIPTSTPPTNSHGNELKRPYPFTSHSDTQASYESISTLGSESAKKRSPRHCSKCGSPECKGKGGRAFCTNPCKDCGKLECKGRNSRRPDKPCSEGWD
ncbi:hypothetical protein K435DRAFT_849893 [Dendrothele bispora CBS 962.96]|uniref:Post-SET domain-containing protein n=1 Tax=Dendrothele bispora (strain CBS 962.96) TaxID=1314807 RepID=A0A4S8MRD8_DENBC|nr:hypothetical protein K435DRAFT_849893 [Dendrothele bispora CBS 962.96]